MLRHTGQLSSPVPAAVGFNLDALEEGRLTAPKGVPRLLSRYHRCRLEASRAASLRLNMIRCRSKVWTGGRRTPDGNTYVYASQNHQWTSVQQMASSAAPWTQRYRSNCSITSLSPTDDA